MPSISVIIPAFKARNFITDSVTSAFAQTLQPLEVLVIDDCSPESVDDLLEPWMHRTEGPALRLIRHDKNQGLGGARNTGMREAKGDFIALLDHDDFWDPNHLENVFAALESKNASMAFASAKMFDTSEPGVVNWIFGPKEDYEKIQDLGWALWRKSFIAPSSVLIRKSLMESLDGFSTDPKVHMCEDLDFWLRLLATGETIAHAKEQTLWYRKHPDAATIKLGYMARQGVYVHEMYYDKVGGDPAEKKRVFIEILWRAAIKLHAAGEKDASKYLFRALAQSWHRPIYTARKIQAYLKRNDRKRSRWTKAR